MPEIKSTFTQGTMNKDLDERLIQNGQYRDALNVYVSTSDEGGAGTVRNILGNTRVDALVPDDMSCVGSIADERNNKLYWFVSGENKDAILEYDQTLGTSKVILADTPQSYDSYKPFLNFTGKQITGINIIDNFLFWSDGDNEPKKINTSISFHTDPNLTLDDPELSPAYLPVNGQLTDTLLREEHITVIKKKPTTAPTVNLVSAKGEAGSAIFERVFLRFCFRYKYADGEYSAFGPFTDVVFNPEYDELINSVNAYSSDEPYNKAMVNLIKSIELYDFITPDMPEDVVQVDILYKQEDSPAIYSIENIRVNSLEANQDGSGQFNVDGSGSLYKGKYEIDSENIHAILPDNQFLRAFDAVPKSALGQEVIGNRIVYGNYKQGYDFTDVVPTIQGYKEKRRSQDFINGGLKSLKSQRKYQLGYVLGDKYGRETPVFTSRQGGVNVPWFDNNSYNASTSNMLNARIYGDMPEWAEYYKFYVKSPSDEYYNLLMDKSYFPFSHNEFENKEDHIYISFPSSDRNKLTEDDYIIAKKIYDSNNEQIQTQNRYKILDISNEAPEAVKYVFYSLGSASNSNNSFCTSATDFGDNGDGTVSLFPGPNVSGKGGRRIDQQVDTIHMSRSAWVSSTFDGVELVDADTEYNNDVYISWNVGNVFSERYKVTSIDISGNNDDYVLKLSNSISEKDAKLAAFDDTITSDEFKLDADLEFKCERRETRGEEDFSGKFFVKIKHQDYLTGNDQEDNLYPISSAKSYWLFGDHGDTQDASLGIVNSQSSTIANSLEGAVTVAASTNMSVTGFANEPEEWASIKEHVGNSFFIDDMNYVAGNPSSASEAKESGKITYGGSGYHKKYEWQTLIKRGEVGDSFQEANPNYAGGDPYGWARYISAPQVPSLQETFQFKSWTPNILYQATEDAFGGYEEVLGDFVNSFEGIVTQTNHGAYNRRTYTDTIYVNQPGDHEFQDNYEDDKHYMHLSFLAPGVDLISGFTSQDLVGVKIKGIDSIASKLQGIWGGGAFTKLPNEPTRGLTTPEFESFGGLPNHLGNCVEFEGNYSSGYEQIEGLTGGPITQSREVPPGPGVGQGYDLNYQTEHEQQWNPAYSSEGNNPEIQAFVERLKTPGQQFKFKNDTGNTVYTILSVKELHIYNHTPWRVRWIATPDNGYTRANNSVEEAASAWADYANALQMPSANSNVDGYSEAAESLASAITNFGRAHNRRTVFILELDKNPEQNYDPRFDTGDIDANESMDIEFITSLAPSSINNLFSSPTVWETEPQRLTDLNIYYEASGNIPTKINAKTRELFAPVGSLITSEDLQEENVYISEWVGDRKFKTNIEVNGSLIASTLRFTRQDGSYVEADVQNQEGQDVFQLNEKVQHAAPVGLSWFNCFSFGDGIESNRIRDGFNLMQITNGARVSTVLEEPFIEEHRTNGLIYSGIYNSNSNLNELNQFIAGEKITKDLNPTYGSIQKLFTRNTDLIALCEDRIIKILANKDAVFNADGNPQLVATTNVLGQAVPFVGDYGISTHPESFASDTYRAYFTDKQRGAVLRLSMDGLTPISSAGMEDYFRDNLVDEANFIGSYDRFNQQYNLTIKKMPIIGSILNDDLSEGVEPISQYNHNDFVSNKNFTEGQALQGETLLEDIIEDNTITPNPELEGSVTIINHPEITELVEPQPIYNEPEPNIEYITIDDVNPNNPDDPNWETYYTDLVTQYSDAFISGQNTLFHNAFGFRSEDITSHGVDGDPFTAGISYASGIARPKFTIDRYRNLSTHTDDGEANIQLHPNYEDGNFNIGFGSAVSGNTNQNVWTNGVRIFAETVGATVPSGLQDGFDEYHVSTTHNGITFRGSPGGTNTPAEGTPWGYIELPNFLPDTNHDLISDTLAEQEPTAKNNTIFHGEEFQVYLKVKANCYGDDRRNHVTVKLYDGSSLVDESLFTGGTTNSDITSPIDFTLANRVQFPDIHNASQNDVTEIYQLHYKVGANSSNLGDIAIQDLRVRIEVWSSGSNINDAALDTLGETVIQTFFVSKYYMLSTQDYTNTTYEIISDNQDVVITVDNTPDPEIIGYTDPIPAEPIPAWAEVVYPEGISGLAITTSDINSSLIDQFGPANPGQEISYIDADGNDQVYLSGSSNGVTEYDPNAPQEQQVSVNHIINTEDGGIIEASLSEVLDANKWYLIEVKVNESLNPANPGLRLLSGSSNQSAFVNDPSYIQIGSFESSSRINLTLLDDQQTYRALFKVLDGVEIDAMRLSFFTNDEQISNNTVTQIRLIDVSTEAIGGVPNNWYIDPVHYNIQRAVIEPAESITQATPAVYYDGSSIVFNEVSESYAPLREVSQTIDLQPTQEGYQFKAYVNNESEGTLLVNINGEDYSLDNPINEINFPEHTGDIKFTALNDFVGKITSVSIKDVTEYFYGGNAGAWVIDGFDTDVDNFISWVSAPDGQIEFINALEGHRFYQQVELTHGQTFKLSFNADIISTETSGKLKVSYRNSSGVEVGSKIISASFSEQFIEFQFMVDNVEGESQDLANCIIFEVFDDQPLKAAIDNIKLVRVITNIEFGAPITTISFKEDVRGWVSFKSFIPENGLSLSSNYFTFDKGQLWQHDTNENRNNFYGLDHVSSITLVMNQEPSAVKSFNAINYEGTANWTVPNIYTDMDEGKINDFVKKENKWFNYVKGIPNNIDTSRLNVQGLGTVSHTTFD